MASPNYPFLWFFRTFFANALYIRMVIIIIDIVIIIKLLTMQIVWNKRYLRKKEKNKVWWIGLVIDFMVKHLWSYLYVNICKQVINWSHNGHCMYIHAIPSSIGLRVWKLFVCRDMFVIVLFWFHLHSVYISFIPYCCLYAKCWL